MFPKKTESIDYNKFSPYTPVPYYVDPFTKYQHAHIDLVGYLNENQLNTNNYYYSNYHDSLNHNDDGKWAINYHNPYNFIESNKSHGTSSNNVHH